MTKRLTLMACALTALLGCAAEDSALNEEFSGSKADEIGDLEFRCAVVSVNANNNFLDEGLGSIYDYDEEGFPEADGDSISVDYRMSSGSELPSGRILGIGQMSIGLHSAEDSIVEIEEEPRFNDETGFFTVEGQRADSDRIFKVRIFSEFMVGIVTYRVADVDACQAKAEVDCDISLVDDGSGDDPAIEAAGCLEDALDDCERDFMLAKIDCRGVDTPFDI